MFLGGFRAHDSFFLIPMQSMHGQSARNSNADMPGYGGENFTLRSLHNCLPLKSILTTRNKQICIS